MKVGVLQTECRQNCSWQINLSKTHTKWRCILNIKGLGSWPNPRMRPWWTPTGHTAHRAKIVAQHQKWFCKSVLFWELRTTPILVTWDWYHWKGYLIIFPCICRTSKTEVVCNLDINLNMRSSWTPSWTRTRQFRIRLVRHLCVQISLALQHLLDASFILHGPLLDS
jgi:hypothetical protein